MKIAKKDTGQSHDWFLIVMHDDENPWAWPVIGRAHCAGTIRTARQRARRLLDKSRGSHPAWVEIWDDDNSVVWTTGELPWEKTSDWDEILGRVRDWEDLPRATPPSRGNVPITRDPKRVPAASPEVGERV